MQHDDDVGPAFQGDPVAGLLVSAVTFVFAMRDGKDAKLPCHLQRIVLARVIDKDDVVDHVRRNFPKGHFERPPRIVGGQHNADFVLSNHANSTLRSASFLTNVLWACWVRERTAGFPPSPERERPRATIAPHTVSPR